jgi:hypothetical protein
MRRLLVLPLFLLAAAGADAEQTASYRVSGTTGAMLWGLGSEPGTAVLALAFRRAVPLEPVPNTAAPPPDDLPPPGPRLVFSVTRRVRMGGAWVRRQWYGDVPLMPDALVAAADLSGGKLDAAVTGTLEESREGELIEHREAPGRLQVQWTAVAGFARTSLAYAFQTPTYGLALQTDGMGRAAWAQATVAVEALGPPLEVEGGGSLMQVVAGLVSVTRP